MLDIHFIFHVRVFLVRMLGAQRSQTRVSDALQLDLTDGCESPSRGRESNPGAVDEQPVL